MSQGSQGPFVNGRLSLPLFKFSHATVHGESTTPIPWIHLGRESNLFAIFETQRAEDGVGQLRDQRKFKVVQGPHVMVWCCGRRPYELLEFGLTGAYQDIGGR